MSDNDSREKQKAFGTVGTVYPICTCTRAGIAIERARSGLSGKASQPSQTVPTGYSERTWSVHVIALPFGIGKYLGRVKAADHETAEKLAVDRFERSDLYVSLAGGHRATAASTPHSRQKQRRRRP